MVEMCTKAYELTSLHGSKANDTIVKLTRYNLGTSVPGFHGPWLFLNLHPLFPQSELHF